MVHPVTIPLDDALQRLLLKAQSADRPAETLPVMDSLYRIAACDYVSVLNLPQTDNAAVDGFAVHSSTLKADPKHVFPIVGTARAGHPFNGVVGPNEALRIYTGAVMPEGPDCVLMHEDCRADEHRVRCDKWVEPQTNIRPAGENLGIGEAVLEKGRRIGPAEMGQLSAAGIAKIKVAPRLNACLLSTGDEVCQPGDNLQTGQIYDSNRPMLTGLLQAYGMNITQSEIVPDSCDALTKAYEKGLENCDVILSSGGASDGVEDHTQAAMRNLGVDLVFWRLAMKPGRPMAVGQKGDKFIFCLPGNPVAAFVCFKLLVMPVLDRLSGGLVRPPLKIGLTSGFHHKKRAGRAEFMRAVVINDKQGKQVVMPYGRKGAGVLSSLTGADGLVEIPLEAELIVPGDQLNFLPFKEQVL